MSCGCPYWKGFPISRPSFSLWIRAVAFILKLEKPVFSQRACRAINTTARWLSVFMVVCTWWNRLMILKCLLCHCEKLCFLQMFRNSWVSSWTGKMDENGCFKVQMPTIYVLLLYKLHNLHIFTYLFRDWSILMRPALWGDEYQFTGQSNKGVVSRVRSFWPVACLHLAATWGALLAFVQTWLYTYKLQVLVAKRINHCSNKRGFPHQSKQTSSSHHWIEPFPTGWRVSIDTLRLFLHPEPLRPGVGTLD